MSLILVSSTSLAVIQQASLLYPQYLKAFLPEPLQTAQVIESRATCSDCLMVKEPFKTGQKFLPGLKCCTFEPFLPNYQVGLILGDSQVQQEPILKKIKERGFAFPLGLNASVRMQTLYNHRDPHDFGRKQELLCPYFDRKASNCGIWPYRGQSCRSFFCVSSHGLAGEKFWDLVSEYLHIIEMGISQVIYLKLGGNDQLIETCLGHFNVFKARPDQLSSDRLDLSTWNEVWRPVLLRHQQQDLEQLPMEDQVTQFYRSCADIFKGLNKGDLMESLEDHHFDDLLELETMLIKNLKGLTT